MNVNEMADSIIEEYTKYSTVEIEPHIRSFISRDRERDTMSTVVKSYEAMTGDTQDKEQGMSKVDYNGWKNYETWAVNVLLSNSEFLYQAMIDTRSEEELHELVVACIDPSEGINLAIVDYTELYTNLHDDAGE